jgi:hypothetical protein
MRRLSPSSAKHRTRSDTTPKRISRRCARKDRARGDDECDRLPLLEENWSPEDLKILEEGGWLEEIAERVRAPGISLSFLAEEAEDERRYQRDARAYRWNRGESRDND